MSPVARQLEDYATFLEKRDNPAVTLISETHSIRILTNTPWRKVTIATNKR